MVQSERRVLWHPRRENKFVVGGNSQITLYEWAAEYPEIRHITSRNDLHHMKCFAWSPDELFDDLLAVGLSTGRVDLIRLEANKQARQSNQLSTGPYVSLPVRSSRSCNALAFCEKDPNYLAVGLDKIRNDPSLTIWDIIADRPKLVVGEQEIDLTASRLRPKPELQKLDNRGDPRVLQQHASTDVITSLAFAPDTTHMLLVGVSHRWLRLFDLRSNTPAVTQTPSKVQEIATDPFDAHRIACFGDSPITGDSTITLWDYRKLSQPLLQFTEKNALADAARPRQGGYAHIEFSSIRRGCLASMEKDAGYVRFWDVTETAPWPSEGSLYGASMDGEGTAKLSGKRTWPNLGWTAPAPTPQQAPMPGTPDRIPQSAYVLSDTRRTKNFSKGLSSFAIVPPTPNNRYPLASSVMILNKDGDLELYQVQDTPKYTAWSARGELALSAGVDMRLIGGGDDTPPSAKVNMGERERTSRSRSGPGYREEHSRGRAAKAGGGLTASARAASIPPTSALFARDDDSIHPVSGVSAQLAMNPPKRAGTSRAYSPASFRKYTNAKERYMDGEATALPPRLASHGRRSGSRQRNSSPGKRKVSGNPKITKPYRGGGALQVIEDDISMDMRRRALRGYSLSKPFENSAIARDYGPHAHSLSEVWSWLHYSRDTLCVPTSRLYGYDFSYHGLLGIWDGFSPMARNASQSRSQAVDDTPVATTRSLLLDLPNSVASAQPIHHSHSNSSGSGSGGGFDRQSTRGGARSQSMSPADMCDQYGNWSAALSALVERRGSDRERSTWKPSLSAPTQKLVQRQLCLQLCGWSLKDDELRAAVKRWAKEGKISKAACWLVFTKQYNKAMDLLMESNDEVQNMMAGTIAALTPHLSSSLGPLKNPELREQYTKLGNRLQDPYFRMIITHLVLGDWTEVLDEELIPFRERLVIAVQFLDDRGLTSYLHRVARSAVQSGTIEGLIVTGLTRSQPPGGPGGGIGGIDILQAYLDHTGDVQTAAMMASYVCPSKFQDSRTLRMVEKWVQTYCDLLDGFKLHHERVGFDIERGQQVLDAAVQNGNGDGRAVGVVPGSHELGLAPPQILIRCHYCNKAVNSAEALLRREAQHHGQKGRPTTCPNCSRSLPKCSVCLMTLAIVDDASREMELGYSQFKDTIDDAIIFCQSCRHGGHASHILEWFLHDNGKRAHGMCPVANCECRCADEY